MTWICVVCAIVALASCSRTDSKGVAAQTPEARLAAVDRNLQVIEAGARAASRERWDPDYIVGMVGRDPQLLFTWVRDNTYWIPYRGVLRGPVGVLMDGHGNSLDRALLLATLLEKAGSTVRLAHGELTQDQAVVLLPALIARQTVFANSRVLETRNAVTRASSALYARVNEQTDRLLHMVQRPDASAGWDASFDSALVAVRDHWWVQQQTGATWIDLDPLSPDAAPSRSIATARDSLLLADLAGASLHHEIDVRVISEQWSDGVVTEHKALEHVLRPADLIGKSVVLQFWPTEWPDDSVAPFDSRSSMRSALLEQREWGALLAVGEEIAASGTLEDSGDDSEAPVRGGAFAALSAGGAFGPPTKTKPPEATGKTLSALWLEYEFRAPGVSPRTIRRVVFDLLGPAARARGRGSALQLDDAKRLERSRSLMMRTEMLALGSAVAPEFVTHLVMANLLGKRDVIRANVAATRRANPPATAATAAPTAGALYALALARQAGSDARFEYSDRPTLFTSHSYPALKETGVAMIDAIDVVANDVGVSLTARDAFAVKLAQGVRDTNAEATVRRNAIVSGNAGDAFAKSSGWVTLASPGRSAVDRLNLPDDVRHRIVEDLTAGYVVVAPAVAVPMAPEPFAGWWRVDPATGHALGLGANGWGVELNENGGGVARATRMSPFFKKLLTRAAIGFEAGYGWCIVPKVEAHLSEWTFTLAGALTDQEECIAVGGVFAVLATVPFLIGEARLGSCSTGSVPPEPPILGEPPEPVVIRNAGKNETLPMGDAKTIDPSKTQGGQGAIPPEAVMPQKTPPPTTIAEARANLEKANARKIELNAAEQKAWEDSLQYRGNHKMDPRLPFDPAVDERLAAIEEAVNAEYIQSYHDWVQAGRDLRNLEAMERGACGHGGFLPPNRPPSK